MLFLTGPALALDKLIITEDDFHSFDADQAAIGQLLFYDKILSGNMNISCGTCHHHTLAGGDGLSLGIGEGGVGVGPERIADTGADRIKKRIPRSAPALWNLGHKSVHTLFHDGRLSISDIYGNGFNSPAEEWLPQGLETIIAAQAVLPLTAQFEMAGNPKENEVVGAVHDRIDAAWPILAKRVRVIPEYGEMFVAAFDHIETPEDVTIVEIANALGAFIGREWQSFDSPYDQWLRAGRPLSDAAERGRQLFFGRAECASCHAGPLFTNQEFYALGLPAFGPGRTRRFDPMPRDVGRMGETDRLEDAYRFRTPSLRNVALTAPYGHNGAYPTLQGMLDHHRDPRAARAAWTRDMARLPDAAWLETIDFVIQSDRREMARQEAKLDLEGIALSNADLDDLEAFLHALTGETALTRPLGRPAHVPSGLPVD
ncbi:MAG: cytochrome c peroxidase [Pseudomonadota bacterium]